MDLQTYYSILKWRGEEPTRLDKSSGKEYGRKIYEQDIALGKTVWVNHALLDFKYYLFYYDPLLSMLSNLKSMDLHEFIVVLLFILNISSILATLTASIGFHKMLSNQTTHTNTQTMIYLDPIDFKQMLSMTLCAALNGFIICMVQLKWRQFEAKNNQTLATFIMNQNGLTVIMFTLCAMSLGYYFVMNQFNFYSWFLVVYALQFMFGYCFEISALYICFIRGWKRDHRMVQLVPRYLEDGSLSTFYLPKCVYYVTYKDYEEWLEYRQMVNGLDTNHYDEQLQQPLLIR
eukprot:185170_1